MSSRTRTALAFVAVAACGAPPPPPPAVAPPTTASVSSSASAPPPAPPTDAERFAALRDRVIASTLVRSPSYGRWLGLHDESDGKVADYSAAGRKKEITDLRDDLAALDAVDATKLSPDDALDLALMKISTRLPLFELLDVENWKKRPSSYAELFSVNDYLDKEYAPLDVRAKRLLSHEEAALAQVGNIRQNLELPLSKAVTGVDVKMYRGFASYLRGEVATRVAAVGDEAFRARFKATNEKLASEATGIADWLEKTALPTADDGHVLGPERYRKLLEAQEGLTTSVEELKRMNEEDLAANRKAFDALAAKGTKTKRPKPSEYLDAARRLTEDARRFVTDHHVVTVPSDDRASVRETPPFARWNPASLDMTGPFESPIVAFFNVTLPDPSLSKKEQEEYVHSLAALRMTAVHEVWPGHFVHGLKARRAPTKFQKIFFSYTFTEGWAHYTEQMMLDEGFGADEPANRMGQLQAALVRNCRFAASIAIHYEKRPLDEVEKRFMHDCKADKPNAREQAIRGTFDPGYFAYTLGKLQIMQLRAVAKQKLADKFSLEKFHDALLAHGSPPVALVRDRVLRDLGVEP